MIKLIPLLLIPLILLHINSISSYFSQDDFFHLRIIMEKSFFDIPSFFVKSLEGQTFYRPLSRETFNLLMYKTFGLNAYAFHLVNLLLIFLCALLIIIVTKKLINNSLIAYLAGFIYQISSVHGIELYYLPSVQTLFSTIFSLISTLFFIKFLNNPKSEIYLLSLLFFLLGLFSHESIIIFPGILFMIGIFFYSKELYLKKLILYLIPFLILGALYLLSVSSLFDLPSQKVYEPVFSSKSVLNTLGWYMLWSFGLPEMLVDFVGPNLQINQKFIDFFPDYTKVVFPALWFIIGFGALLTISIKKVLINTGIIIFSIFSFLISLSPFLFFPQHKFVYYLTFPIVWFSLGLAALLANVWKLGLIHKVLAIFIVGSLLTISIKTTDINSITHWAAKRQLAAKFILRDLQKVHPNPQKGSIFYIMDDPNYPNIAKDWGSSSQQAFYILSGADAFGLIYKDPTIKAYYQALDRQPKGIDASKLVIYTAKFPY